jgi:AMMECR1 domain-containing protein
MGKDWQTGRHGVIRVSWRPVMNWVWPKVAPESKWKAMRIHLATIFTKAAKEKNAEKLRVVHDTKMAADYAQNWNVHRQHSEPSTGLPGHSQSEQRKRQ